MKEWQICLLAEVVLPGTSMTSTLRYHNFTQYHYDVIVQREENVVQILLYIKLIMFHNYKTGDKYYLDRITLTVSS
jgi:hypothetical protein